MPNKMLIDATHPEETRVVVVRGNRVEEFDFETAQRKQLRGNIYLAKVTRVEPSLQAAFIEYGGNRHGFLAFSEIHPDYYQIPVADRQALIEADERAHREAEEETDNRSNRKRPRHRNSRRRGSSERVQSDVVEGAPLDPLQAEQPRDPEFAVHDAEHDHAHAHDVGHHAADAEHHDHDGHEHTHAHEHAEGEHAEGAHAHEAHDHEHVAAETPAPEAQPEQPVSAGFAPEPIAEAHEPVAPVAHDDHGHDEHHNEAHAAENAAHAEDAHHHDEHSDAEHAAAADNDEQDDDEDDGEEAEEDIVESVGGEDVLEEVPDRAFRPRRQYKIQEVIKRRQVMLVQVVKEERGNKGAALTTYLSLAGRYAVLMPNTARGGGISRKITSAQDRSRLKEVVSDL
ncbi:MAG: ribonuclease, partial [Tardiphaga sp.]|nr:ribonuclease [Tardiphaga sp.]